ncbi:hypothetical protein AMP9_1077 [plant metagenome]|uniref:Uncharacterized protein n=1 Tax=plant metagenome TaxID=1297885 RepID=A0A484NUJ7_9ZZZZ
MGGGGVAHGYPHVEDMPAPRQQRATPRSLAPGLCRDGAARSRKRFACGPAL